MTKVMMLSLPSPTIHDPLALAQDDAMVRLGGGAAWTRVGSIRMQSAAKAVAAVIAVAHEVRRALRETMARTVQSLSWWRSTGKEGQLEHAGVSEDRRARRTGVVMVACVRKAYSYILVRVRAGESLLQKGVVDLRHECNGRKQGAGDVRGMD